MTTAWFAVSLIASVRDEASSMAQPVRGGRLAEL
jgi:hypothetical protein